MRLICLVPYEPCEDDVYDDSDDEDQHSSIMPFASPSALPMGMQQWVAQNLHGVNLDQDETHDVRKQSSEGAAFAKAIAMHGPLVRFYVQLEKWHRLRAVAQMHP